MFRYKDREQKKLKCIKKQNDNKETRVKIMCKESHGDYFYGEHKALQQYLSDEFDIKIHKNVLKSKCPVGPGYTIINKINKIDEFDQLNDKSKLVGNITSDKLEHVICKININDLPLDWSKKHDKTRWNTNKTKTTMRNKSRDAKMCEN